MNITMNHMKLVVRDLDASERFYRAMGFQVVSRNVGGEDEVRQSQSWLSATGDTNAFVLILSQFLEFPPPAQVVYPGEAWLVFTTSDVDATVDAVKKNGGAVLRAGQDRPEHSVRAAVVSDPEGHVIEVVGPMVER
jgi:catechol 2,3-dioxygenase-like lactoylglutathione lyase family enzyme